MTIQSLHEKHKWQDKACEKCKLAFNEFERLEALEGGDTDAIDAAVRMTTKALSNLQYPVMTCWGTMVYSCGHHIFANNWVVIYFFITTLVNSQKSNLHVSIMCSTLLSLMHNVDVLTMTCAANKNAHPTVDGKEIDAYIAAVGSKKLPEEKDKMGIDISATQIQ